MNPRRSKIIYNDKDMIDINRSRECYRNGSSYGVTNYSTKMFKSCKRNTKSSYNASPKTISFEYPSIKSPYDGK